MALPVDLRYRIMLIGLCDESIDYLRTVPRPPLISKVKQKEMLAE